MKEREPNAHKEKVYGWYPSQRNVYQKQAFSTTYDMEMLYKNSMSAAANQPGTASIQPPTPVAITLQSPHPPSTAGSVRTGFRPGSYFKGSPKSGNVKKARTESVRTPQPPSPGVAKSIDPQVMLAAAQKSMKKQGRETSPGRRIKSAPPSTGHRTPMTPPEDRVVRPQTGKMWRTSVPATTMSPAIAHQLQEHREAWVPQTPDEIERKMTDVQRFQRAQSALAHRTRVPSTTPRQIKSAGSKRSEVIASHDKRPKNPIPPTATPPVDEVIGAEDTPVQEPLDYEKELKKYGWKFEIPGDPFGLKQKCLPQRPKFYSKCKIPTVEPEPPTVHMEASDTFFYNTIPRRPLTYTIGRDWISEVIHAKRMELQKREGLKYRWKNFSFVY